jgi:hypothetical protein
MLARGRGARGRRPSPTRCSWPARSPRPRSSRGSPDWSRSRVSPGARGTCPSARGARRRSSSASSSRSRDPLSRPRLLRARRGGAAVRVRRTGLPSPPVLVLAVDGLDGDLVAALEPRGAVDHLLATIAAGTMFPKHGERGREPAEVWTTIMTGEPPEVHGVRAAGLSVLPGVAAPLAPGTGPAAFEAALPLPAPLAHRPRQRRGTARPYGVGDRGPLASDGRRRLLVLVARARDRRGRDGFLHRVRPRPREAPRRCHGGSRRRAGVALRARGSRPPAGQGGAQAAFEARFTSLPESVASVAWESLLIDGFAWRTARRLEADPAVGSVFSISRASTSSGPGSPARSEREMPVRRSAPARWSRT